ncbi:MAG TPA: hypothetical protein VI504_08065 [Candidatus Eisenbacteria bacterium]|jgi:hypothetical protein
MNDRFLNEQRREPAPGYGRALRERLRGLEEEAPARGFRFHPALATALVVALAGASFALPAVRVAAQSALDLFRVHSFAAVEVDQARIEQLKKLHDQSEGDPTMMVFDKQQVLQDPGQPVEYTSADLAGSAAGLPGLRKPTSLPAGLAFEKAAVTGRGEARLTLHADRLQHVLDALGITDVRVPIGLDGQSVTVRMPPSVVQHYTNGKRTLTVIQGTSPEVALPPGANLQQLGELGLRVLGLDASEARRIAASVDWRSTLLVPVPAAAASFRQVDVNGHKGLFVRMEGDGKSEGPSGQRGAMVMWTEGERVLAVQSNLSDEDVLEVAQSLR